HFTAEDIGKLLGILAFAFSFLAIWLYLRWRARNNHVVLDNTKIILASLLYTFAPYRIFNYATRGALPEHLAFAFVPFAFWGIDLLLHKKWRAGFPLLTLALSLLILTNLPATAVAGIGIFLYVLFQERKKRSDGWKGILCGGVAALLLTAFYLLPVEQMFGLVQMERLWRAVPLVQSTPFLAIFTGEALTINSYTFIMLIGACALWIVWFRSGNFARPFSWIVAFIIAAQLPIVTQYLYRFVPPFTIVQLASRFSILLILIAALAWQDEGNRASKQFPIVSWVVVFWSVCTIGLVSLQLADIHIHKHGPLAIGEAPEYATKWAKPYYIWGNSLAAPFENDSQTVVCHNAKTISAHRTAYTDSITVEADPNATALLRRAYWPEWKAEIDGTDANLLADSLGRITVILPQGKHTLILRLQEASSVKLGVWISFAAFIILMGSVLIPNHKKTSS
ncbi:MAG TPA: hypothetical protein VGM92_01025, partial [Candidatus Kapabacteria bacterium]